ncbi:glutamate racemase [uncultured Ferrimonas sp.]|uniref:glutamate racemase n=1 Tax=uncultured Ferrimonas sp. TaxID=432640 RepID=UPI00261C6B18|nr:glutamate racemase [uncultured Ferrimonas sp.]
MASILLFDSGIGGLSIQHHITQRLPELTIHYLADNQRFPYGELSEPQLINGCVSLIQRFLAEHDISLVVIACNSASTLVLAALRQQISVPVVGVVPAVKPAAQLTTNKVVGLLATPGTIQRQYTNELIKAHASDCEVLRIGTSELVQLAECKLSGQTVNRQQLQQILMPFIHARTMPDTIVLGCTHFPLLADELTAVLGEQVQLVDSGVAVARRVEDQLPTTMAVNSSTVASKTNQFFYTGSAPNVALQQQLQKLGFSQCRLFNA